jgi:hypothetical protein
MVDFSSLVLAPNMAVFGKSITITPVASQPNGQPYLAQGIWAVTSQSIMNEAGNILSTVGLKLSIRMADFTVPPSQGDWVTVAASDLPLGYWQGVLVPNANLDFEIDTFTPDGQGAAVMTLNHVVDVNP